MRSNKIWLVIPILVCCLLVGCGAHTQKDVDAAYASGRSIGHDEGYESGYEEGHKEGYDDGYYHAYEEAYEKAREELIDELYSVDGYVPVYVSEEVIDDLFYLVEENNGERYRPEEYANIVWDFFEANSYYMTAEQTEAFANVLTFCDDAEWITRNIMHDIQFPPS